MRWSWGSSTGVGLLLIMTAEASAKPPVDYAVRFYYAVDKEMNEKVLHFEETFTNRGTAPMVLTTWPELPFVKRAAGDALRSTRRMRNDGKPAAPKPTDVVRLAPGAKVSRIRWFWADGQLPFASKPVAMKHTLYEIKRPSDLELTLCVTLTNPDAVKALLSPNEALITGELCAAARFRYEILQKDN